MTPLSDFGIGWQKRFSFISEIKRLSSDNKKLADQLLQAEVDSSKIKELEFENGLLKKELGFKEENVDLSLLPSHVIGREPTSFLDHIMIDKGSADGVEVNMAVISGGVLVGQVRETFDNESIVTLITSKDSLILSMLQDSRAKGLLRGGISGLILENIAQDVDCKPGEDVVTSGLDGELKPGILIGKTGSLESSTSDLYKNISVEPLSDLSKLELVFIML